MSQKQIIETKVRDHFKPVHLEVINESFMHSVPQGSETHFKLVVVSSLFEGKNPVARHRILNQLLADELKNGVHALSLHTFTPAEWSQKGQKVEASPACHAK